MIYEFPQGGCTYQRSAVHLAWIKDEFHGGQIDKGAWMTIEAPTFWEARVKFSEYVKIGRKFGYYL